MLTRVEIDGFKTFREFALDVPPLLVVLGRNAAGKSNLFDALAFLSALARGRSVREVVRETRGGLLGVLHRDTAGEPMETIRLAVELRAATARDQDARYELELRVRSEDPLDRWGTAALTVVGERVAVRDRSDGSAPDAWRYLEYLPAGEGPEDEDPSRRYPSEHVLRPAVAPSPPGRVSLEKAQAAPVVSRLRKELAAWRVMALEASALRASDSYDDEDSLTQQGGHLPNTIARLVRRSRTADRPNGILTDLAAELAAVVPDVVDLRLDEDEHRRLRTVLFRTKGQNEYRAADVSDGTLRALALVVALRDTDRGGLLCLEEPQNGIYPGMLTRFVRRLERWSHEQDTSRGGQIIVSSHSPAVLRALPAAASGESLRPQVTFLDLVSRTTEGAPSRVTRARRLRAEAPLGPDVELPVLSLAEIDEFLGGEGAR